MPEKLLSFFGDPALRYISNLTEGVQKLIFSLDHVRLAPFAVLISVRLAQGAIQLIIEWAGGFAE